MEGSVLVSPFETLSKCPLVCESVEFLENFRGEFVLYRVTWSTVKFRRNFIYFADPNAPLKSMSDRHSFLINKALLNEIQNLTFG